MFLLGYEKGVTQPTWVSLVRHSGEVYINTPSTPLIAAEPCRTTTVSKLEKIARNIFEVSPDVLGCSNYSELANACLIDAYIANESVGKGWIKNRVEFDLAGSARMFGFESLLWKDEAKNGKGYWFDSLHNDKA